MEGRCVWGERQVVKDVKQVGEGCKVVTLILYSISFIITGFTGLHSSSFQGTAYVLCYSMYTYVHTPYLCISALY